MGLRLFLRSPLSRQATPNCDIDGHIGVLTDWRWRAEAGLRGLRLKREASLALTCQQRICFHLRHALVPRSAPRANRHFFVCVWGRALRIICCISSSMQALLQYPEELRAVSVISFVNPHALNAALVSVGLPLNGRYVGRRTPAQ